MQSDRICQFLGHMDELMVARGRGGGGEELWLTIQGVAVEIGDDPIAGALFSHSERESKSIIMKVQNLEQVDRVNLNFPICTPVWE